MSKGIVIIFTAACIVVAKTGVAILFNTESNIEKLYDIAEVHQPVMYACIDTVSKSGQGFYSPFSTPRVCACISKYVLAEIPTNDHAQFSLHFSNSMNDISADTTSPLRKKADNYVSICADERNHTQRSQRLRIARMEPLKTKPKSIHLRGASK